MKHRIEKPLIFVNKDICVPDLFSIFRPSYSLCTPISTIPDKKDARVAG